MYDVKFNGKLDNHHQIKAKFNGLNGSDIFDANFFNSMKHNASQSIDKPQNFSTGTDVELKRILIADDHDLVRESIGSFLEHEMVVKVELFANLDEALKAVKSSKPFDIILLDNNMPGMDGLNGLELMLDICENSPVAILSSIASLSFANKVLEVGASGFLPKTLSVQSMTAAVKFILDGEIYAPIKLLKNQTDYVDDLLSKREIDVLTGISEGKSNKEIAIELDLQEVTIKLHAKTLSRKLKARNRTHAAMIARDRHLI
jgi:DNA-binding NarL/FixJ family response regulator